MMTLEDGDRAREVFRHNQTGYHTSLVAKYLDSFPQAAGIDKTPELAPPIPLEQVNKAIEMGAIAVGTPEEAINTMRIYEAIGADQVSFGALSDDTPFDAAVESVETFGKFVLPEFDKDPVHSTTRRPRGAARSLSASRGTPANPSCASAAAALAAMTGCTTTYASRSARSIWS